MPPDDSSAASSSTSSAEIYTKVLQGRYELGRVLGRGGSSKVYRARDVRTGVHVAVKAVRKPHHPCSPEDAAAARRSLVPWGGASTEVSAGAFEQIDDLVALFGGVCGCG